MLASILLWTWVQPALVCLLREIVSKAQTLHGTPSLSVDWWAAFLTQDPQARYNSRQNGVGCCCSLITLIITPICTIFGINRLFKCYAKQCMGSLVLTSKSTFTMLCDMDIGINRCCGMVSLRQSHSTPFDVTERHSTSLSTDHHNIRKCNPINAYFYWRSVWCIKCHTILYTTRCNC